MLSKKVIVITGAAGKIGKGFVHAINQKGGIVIVADIDFDAAKQTVSEITNVNKTKIIAMNLDITNKASISLMINKIIKDFGKIDAVVNNAYPRNNNYGRKLEEVEFKDFCENLDNHLGGYFLISQQFCQYFMQQGNGNIINIASIYGSIAPRFQIYEETEMTMPVEYAAIKAGIIQLTRYFAQYYKGSGIRVNSLSPGGILNDQPIKFIEKYKNFCGKKGMLDVNDITGTLLFLLSDNSKFMTGQNIIIDDGYSL